MLPYVLALVIALGSFAFYMAAFFFPEVHRKNDFIWSGVGFFYALVLWVCAGRITGAVLLSQMASVSLLGWLGYQTLFLRRQLTLPDQQTPVPTSAEFTERLATLLSPGGLAALFQEVGKSFKTLSSSRKPVAPIVNTPVETPVSTPEAMIPDTPPTETIPEWVPEVTVEEKPTIAEIAVDLTADRADQDNITEEVAIVEPVAKVEPEAIAETIPTLEPPEAELWDSAPAVEAPAPSISPPVKEKGGLGKVGGFLKNVFSRTKQKPKPPTSPTSPQPEPTLPEEAIALADETIVAESILVEGVDETPVSETPPPVSPPADDAITPEVIFTEEVIETVEPSPTLETETTETVSYPLEEEPSAEEESPEPNEPTPSSPKLIRPNPPNPKLVEAAKKSTAADQPESQEHPDSHSTPPEEES